MAGGWATEDSTFSRSGTVNTENWRNITPGMQDLFDVGFAASNPNNTNSQVTNHLQDTMTLDRNDLPMYTELFELVQANAPGTAVPGQTSLEAQAAVNPYTGAYEENTYNRYQQDVANAASNLRSGQMTRGGTAAQGFAQSQAINDAALNRQQVLTGNRLADAQIQGNAASNLHTMQGRDTGEALTGINTAMSNFGNLVALQNQAAGEARNQSDPFYRLLTDYTNLAARQHGKEVNDLQGRGSQTSQSMGLNVCCFIFLEAYKGKLPWWVRVCRDEFAPESSARRNGYIRMARWLVPAMRTSKTVRWLTDKLMIEPLTRWGGYYKNIKGYRHGRFFKPFVNFWFTFWSFYGKGGYK